MPTRTEKYKFMKALCWKSVYYLQHYTGFDEMVFQGLIAGHLKENNARQSSTTIFTNAYSPFFIQSVYFDSQPSAEVLLSGNVK